MQWIVDSLRQPAQSLEKQNLHKKGIVTVWWSAVGFINHSAKSSRLRSIANKLMKCTSLVNGTRARRTFDTTEVNRNGLQNSVASAMLAEPPVYQLPLFQHLDNFLSEKCFRLQTSRILCNRNKKICFSSNEANWCVCIIVFWQLKFIVSLHLPSHFCLTQNKQFIL